MQFSTRWAVMENNLSCVGKLPIVFWESFDQLYELEEHSSCEYLLTEWEHHNHIVELKPQCSCCIYNFPQFELAFDMNHSCHDVQLLIQTIEEPKAMFLFIAQHLFSSLLIMLPLSSDASQ